MSILILKNENLKGVEIFIKKLGLKFHFLHFFHFSRIICNKQRRRNQKLFTCVNCKLRCYIKCIGINETVKLNENQSTCSNCKPNDNSNTFTLDYLESDNVEACSKFDKISCVKPGHEISQQVYVFLYEHKTVSVFSSHTSRTVDKQFCRLIIPY